MAANGGTVWDTLSQDQRSYVALRVRGRRIHTVCETLELPRSTVQRWETEQWFQDATEFERARWLDGGRVAYFEPLLPDAWDALANNLKCDVPAVRQQALEHVHEQVFGKALQQVNNQTNIDVTIDALDGFVNALRNTKIIDATVTSTNNENDAPPAT